MVNLYVRRIKNGLMKLQDVPMFWRSLVEAKLDVLFE